MSRVTALYHIVFCTKRREASIPQLLCEEVYRFIWAIVKEHKSRLLRIGGTENHIHMLVDLSPDVKLSELMRNVKSNTSGWMHRDGRFTHFDGWAREYFAETISVEGKNGVINYINNQRVHHKSRNIDDELNELFMRAGFTFDNNMLM